jgi:tetratricopeptide (TPR) repeat protein
MPQRPPILTEIPEDHKSSIPDMAAPHSASAVAQMLLDCPTEELPTFLETHYELVTPEVVLTMEHLAREMQKRGEGHSRDATFLRSVAEGLRIDLRMPPLDRSEDYRAFFEEFREHPEDTGDLITRYAHLHEDPRFAATLRKEAARLEAGGREVIGHRLRSVADSMEGPLLLTRMIEKIRELHDNVQPENLTAEIASPTIFRMLDESETSVNHLMLQAAREGLRNIVELTGPPMRSELGRVFGTLGQIVAQYPRERMLSQELAIVLVETALGIFDPENTPGLCANANNDLSTAYRQRSLGDREANVARSIKYAESGAAGFLRAKVPHAWGLAQMNLGTAYTEHPGQSRAANLDSALKAHQAALTVLTREEYPLDWAKVHLNLGTVWVQRPQGDRASNIENAIGCYGNAASVFTKDGSAEGWALAHMNLGNAYLFRIRGDDAENVETAIREYQKALTVFQQKDFPVDWAKAHINLASAYRDRVRGDQAENLDLAIQLYKEALTGLAKDDFPELWARLQTNLANAWFTRIRGNPEDNCELCIEAHKASFSVFTRKAYPIDWARGQLNLAQAFLGRTRGSSKENRWKCLLAVKRALVIYTHESDAVAWALGQNILGGAYAVREG